MKKQKRKYTPLTRKVNGIILISLLLGVGIVAAINTYSTLQELENENLDKLLKLSNLVKESTRTVMLNGEAPLAVDYFRNLEKNQDLGTTIKLYRSTGKEAFSDNTTIQEVNTRLARRKFMLRDGDTVNALVLPDDQLRAAVSPSNDYVSYQRNESGKTIFTTNRWLMNRSDCWKCHGTGGTFRGVISIETDITDEVNARYTLFGLVVFLFLILVAVLAVVLTQYLRRTVIRPVQVIGNVCENVTNGIFDDRVNLKNNDEIGRLGDTVNKMVIGLHERFALSKFVSSSTLQSLTSDKAGENISLTILFSDIRGFTSYSEHKKPEEVVESLNKVLNVQTEIITSFGGDVDKYVGDEIVAFYTNENPELSACRSALAIQKELTAKSDSDYHGLSVGIGINCGDVILGLVGSEKRADYTIIGDNVNTTSRLCSAAKKNQIIIADNVHQKVKKQFRGEGPFRVKVKGKSAYIRVYILTGLEEGA
ncbi:MAG: adenylate/guanylate cyclase domain-containing protein [Spirochaetales bacterium]|nr:adenylate/guanylate cyclase domain-containing protein [Spirochaetales bacterium]